MPNDQVVYVATGAIIFLLLFVVIIGGNIHLPSFKPSQPAIKPYVYPYPVPTMPTIFTVQNGNHQIILSWIPPQSIATGVPMIGYNIYRGIHTGTEKLLISIGNQSEYIDSNVTSGGMYYYTMSAFNRVGESVKTNETNSLTLG